MPNRFSIIAMLLLMGLNGSVPQVDAFAEENLDSTPIQLAAKKIDFVRDIRPIFQRACIQCHGPDKQKGGYRLDLRDVALTGGESYSPNIVLRNSAQSPLIKFVAGIGDLLMPPEGERLTSEEIGMLRAWIDQGAQWPDEFAGTANDKRELWSLKPLIRPPIPRFENIDVTQSPVDAFILEKLAGLGVSHSPEADRQTLIRRLSFDLIGLPPTPDEVDAFVADPDTNAYSKLIDRLLESPRYGERWARHWMDAAHFAETHGNDQDRIRENAWPYRDYLVSAFNRDIPYSHFIQEQIAGDVLFPEDNRGIAALGFLAAGPWDESSLRDIREDTLDRQVARYLDRDDMLSTVMNNVTSMTVQCARCHDHKFDPISQRDYYSLQAVFSGVERANRRYDPDPQVHQQRLALLRRQSELQKPSSQTVSWLMSTEVQKEVSEWEQLVHSQTTQWMIVDFSSFTSSDGATLTKLSDGSILSSGPRPDRDIVSLASGQISSNFLTLKEDVHNAGSRDANTERSDDVTITKHKTLTKITAIRLDVLADDSLPRNGPGRQDNGNFHLSEFEMFVEGRSQPETFVNVTADFNQQGWEITKSVDQNESTAWGIDPKEGVSHHAVFELKEPVLLGKLGNEKTDETRLKFVLKQLHGRAHLIGRMKISVTDAPTPLESRLLPDSIAAILMIDYDARNDTQRLELAKYHQLEKVNRALSQLPKPSLVYAAAAEFEPDGSLRPPPGPRPIHVLHRGDIRQPRQAVSPGALECIASVNSQFEVPASSNEELRRAALAKWLTDKNNPLTWRSIVNRIWHHHFGQGLVRTLNDFGHMGEKPSHPELLDWLAVEFRDNGQSFKEFHRLVLNSRTYRQQVQTPTPVQRITQGQEHRNPTETNVDPRLTRDANNQRLWRMNRIRLDAECIRDTVLAVSGRLDFKMGGPSDRHFDLQPGIHVTPRVDYSKFDLKSDPGRRRSIYRFLFRTLPDPFMESLDCPSGDQITPVRGNNVTVQQTLALWNDAFIAYHCEQTADCIHRDVAQESDDPKSTRAREVELAVRLILGRRPHPKETVQFLGYTRKHGIANFCRLLLNSNEFLFVN